MTHITDDHSTGAEVSLERAADLVRLELNRPHALNTMTSSFLDLLL